MRIGVIAAQGAFIEHISLLRKLGVDAFPVRLPRDMEHTDGLIIPGGESTSISQLMTEYRLSERIRELAGEGLPMFGTCAGMIILANEISDGEKVQPLGLMNIKVRRNAFGRQVDSFEADLAIPVLGEKPFHGVFIRAPFIEDVKSGEALAMLDDSTVVAARQGRYLVSSFHPELTDDPRFHQYFLEMVEGRD
ncbi:MAG: pyridoxal 5'-phosphate synthase glutaminase subunit PdxT [Chloroflexi bacterium]|nr:pyridoxal 5'-phosphate synthase glutaminase subunit PdxT [Chloroflexota bacterium]